jgi:hypothetical protein
MALGLRVGVASVGLAADLPPELPTVSLGAGPSWLVEYDTEFRPLRRFTGLRKPVDLTPLADGSVLLVDEGDRRVMQFDTSGTVLWSEHIEDPPLRARPRSGGGSLITTASGIIAMHPDRTVAWHRKVGGIKAAVSLSTGNVLTATNDEGQGWLTETTADGAIRWKSQPRRHRDSAGQWIEEQPGKAFVSLSALDVSPDGTVLAGEFDGGRVFLLSRNYDVLRAIGGFNHLTDARIGPAGELVVVSPEDYLVWLELPGGTPTRYRASSRPTCANLTRRGTLLVGFTWEPERAVLNATARRSENPAEIRWWRRGLPVPLLASLLSVLTVVVLRRLTIGNRERRRARRDSLISEDHQPKPRQEVRCADEVPGDGARKGVARARARPWIVVAALIALGLGGYLAWSGIGLVRQSGLGSGFSTFAFGCVAAGVALRVLHALAGSAASLSSFVPPGREAPEPPLPREGRISAPTAVLFALSTVSLAGCMLTLLLLREEQAVAVGLWLAAQVFLLSAAYPPVPSSEATPARFRIAMGLVLLGTVVTRFWEIGYLPDNVHHDQSAY